MHSQNQTTIPVTDVQIDRWLMKPTLSEKDVYWQKPLKRYRVRNRYYSSELGRFVSRDPIRYVGDLASLYRFLRNTPGFWLDPLGLNPGDPFPTLEAAGKDAIEYINQTSINDNLEYGGTIYIDPNDGQYYATTPVKGDEDGVDPFLSSPPSGIQPVGDYHTHANYSIIDPLKGIVPTGDPKNDDFNSDKWSSEDIKGVDQDAKGKKEYKSYLGTPSGNCYEYNPITGKKKRVK